MKLPLVAIIDTGIFVELLGVPGLSSQQPTVIAEFKARLKRGDELLLPVATIVETGNHIANMSGNPHKVAKKFVGEVVGALQGNRPYVATAPLDPKWITEWLPDFPAHAVAGRGVADLSIIEEWKRLKKKVGKTRRVQIWSLDSDLAGYDS